MSGKGEPTFARGGLRRRAMSTGAILVVAWFPDHATLPTKGLLFSLLLGFFMCRIEKTGVALDCYASKSSSYKESRTISSPIAGTTYRMRSM